MRKKYSKIWNPSKEDIIEIIKNSTSLGQVLNKIGVRSDGGNYATLRRRCNQENIDISKFPKGLNHRLGCKYKKREVPLDKILNINISYPSYTLKKRLVDDGLLKYECKKCGNTGIWMNEKIILHLDHINGIHTDNRIENLQILCPNCHSQTPTYGRKKKDSIIKETVCSCGKIISNKSISCKECYNKNRIHKTKIQWPTDRELGKLLYEYPISTLSKKLKVSDRAIAKRCDIRNIERPLRGYWNFYINRIK